MPIKFNVIIAKRNRTKEFETCLHYLNLANEGNKHDVNINITSDSDEIISLPEEYLNLGVHTFYLEVSGPFNKSKLLNHSIEKMRLDFDALTVVDIDMVYVPEFFNNMVDYLSKNDYIVSTGFKLKPQGTEVLKNTLPSFEVIKNMENEEFLVGPSQITIKNSCYKLFIDLFGAPLYNINYRGWG